MSANKVPEPSVTILFSGFLLSAFLLCAAGAFGQDAEYVGNFRCKMCHNKEDKGAVWDKWKAMAHAKAFETLKGDAAKAIAESAGLEQPAFESSECLGCHVTGFDAAKKRAVPAKLKAKEGVQCESCHGSASLHTKDGQKLKVKKSASVDLSAHIKRPTEKTCAACHNEKSPTWNPAKYTLEDGRKAGFDFKQAWKQIEHGLVREEAES